MSQRGSVPDVSDVTRGEPKGYFVIMPSGRDEDVIDLVAVFHLLLQSWKLILGVSLLCAVIAAGIALQMRKSYRAQTLVAPVAQNNTFGGSKTGQLGGLAALAGIDLGGSSRSDESLATLSSPGFARDFIQRNNLIPTLFAEDWNASTGKWREGVKPPSLEKAVRKFTKDVCTIATDRKTGLVTVRIEWYSPELAAQWANQMVEIANERLRSAAILEAQESIEYLEKELAKTNVVEARQTIYRLVEGQINNAMLANVQREYAFRFIDRAVPPDMRSSPKRTLMVLIGGALGFVFAVMLVFIRDILKRRPQ